MDVPVEVPDDHVLTEGNRCGHPASRQLVLLPQRCSRAPIERPHVVAVVGDVEHVARDAHVVVHGDLARPEDLSGLQGDGHHPTLEGGGVHVALHDRRGAVDIDHALKLGATARHGHRGFPELTPVGGVQRHELAVVETGHHGAVDDHRRPRPPQGQHGHTAVVTPPPLTAAGAQCEDLTVHGARGHQVTAAGGRGEHLARYGARPQPLAAAGIERDDTRVTGAEQDLAGREPDAAGDRQLRVGRPDALSGGRLHGNDSPVSACRIDHFARRGRTQREVPLSAPRPDVAFPEPLGLELRIDRHQGRGRGGGLATAGPQQEAETEAESREPPRPHDGDSASAAARSSSLSLIRNRLPAPAPVAANAAR